MNMVAMDRLMREMDQELDAVRARYVDRVRGLVKDTMETWRLENPGRSIRFIQSSGETWFMVDRLYLCTDVDLQTVARWAGDMARPSRLNGSLPE